MDVLLVVSGFLIALFVSVPLGVALIVLGVALWFVAEYGARRMRPRP
jgi:hypothetical protein